jgi:hypothetical protein
MRRPDEQSDSRNKSRCCPHIASLMRATYSHVTTGLDPVVHAAGPSPWIAGAKSGNDALQTWWHETER